MHRRTPKAWLPTGQPDYQALKNFALALSRPHSIERKESIATVEVRIRRINRGVAILGNGRDNEVRQR